MRPIGLLCLLFALPLQAAEKPPAPEADPILAPYLMPGILSVMQVLYPDAFWRVPAKERVVALGFDDGPSRFTPALLEVLARQNVEATFFVLGDRIDRHPAILRRIVREGHQVALHGLTHRSLHDVPNAEIRADLTALKAKLRDVLGPEATPLEWFLRPPFLDVSQRIIATAKESGCTVTLCTILPGDEALAPPGWRETPDRTAARVVRDIQPGGILCLHDGEDIGAHDGVYDMPQAAATAEAVIVALKQKGYRFVTVAELARMRDKD
jgi:peptidoglycan/xylan/chitin deacetylase (PgdA/CDA1 family)